MKNFIKEFKEFIAKGNAMTMAIGIIIGGAFTAIVNSLVNDIFMPLLGIVLGGVNFKGITLTVGHATLFVGNFIQAIITFILIALVIFLMVRSFNKMKKKQADDEAKAEEVAEPSHQEKLLEEILEVLKQK